MQFDITDEDLNNCSNYLGEVLNIKSIRFDPFVLKEVIYRCVGDIKRIKYAHAHIELLSIQKQAGILVYWFTKLKPIVTCLPKQYTINELFAFSLGLSMCQKFYCDIPKLKKSFVNEILYTIRYRTITQETLGIIFSQIYKD